MKPPTKRRLWALLFRALAVIVHRQAFPDFPGPGPGLGTQDERDHDGARGLRRRARGPHDGGIGMTPQPPSRVLVRTGKDCFRACLASLLAVELDDVPAFEGLGPGEWLRAAQDWAAELGFLLTDYLVGDPFYIQALDDPGGGAHGHAVISIDGARAFDPGENWPEFDAEAWPDAGRYYLFPVRSHSLEAQAHEARGAELEASLERIDELTAANQQLASSVRRLEALAMEGTTEYDVGATKALEAIAGFPCDAVNAGGNRCGDACPACIATAELERLKNG